MAAINKVMLIGNLTRDPEVKQTPSGVAVSTLGIAVNESFRNRNGEKVERTVFVDVDVWDRQAETCAEYLSKGSPAYVEGRLQLDEWDDKETGKKRTRLKVRADRVQFLSSGKANAEGRCDIANKTKEAFAASPAVKTDDEEIPF